jgi:oligopeptide/dipeptide ABC transporter ATP-binding protein
MPEPILSVRQLRVSIRQDDRTAAVVDGVSFDLAGGETLALVGESGCGKTLTALSLVGLLPSPPARVDGGRVLFRGRDLLQLGASELRRVRGREISMVFQDPASCLNPVMTVGRQIEEVLRHHRKLPRRAARLEAAALLERLGVPSAEMRSRSYPHQLSTGLEQRALLAMALACEPAVLIADEPTTALDVTVQAQILALLREVQSARGMSIILITHDMGVVAEVADRVLVLYAGRVVESAPAVEIFERPRHPYTLGLFASLPRARASKVSLGAIPGDVPNPFAFPRGCRFHPRCPIAVEGCARDEPELRAAGEKHSSACARLEGGEIPAVRWPEERQGASTSSSCRSAPP